MKIELEIPDWATETRLLIIAGNECVAHKRPQDNHWLVKEERCDLCGKCCLSGGISAFGTTDDGLCVKLKKIGGKWECTAGLDKPIRCTIDPNIAGYKACGITHKKVKIGNR